MQFELLKMLTLGKAFTQDRSKKGSIDEDILPLVNLINSSRSYYTTSSCAGRIMLFRESKIGRKNDSEWLFITHSSTSFEQLQAHLHSPPEETVWLRMEPPIIHICAKDMDAADKLLKIANDSGFRRSGLLSVKKRLIIEIMIPERLDAPVSSEKNIIVSNDYLKFLVKYANQRLELSRKKLKKFETVFASLSD